MIFGLDLVNLGKFDLGDTSLDVEETPIALSMPSVFTAVSSLLL